MEIKFRYYVALSHTQITNLQRFCNYVAEGVAASQPNLCRIMRNMKNKPRSGETFQKSCYDS